MKKIISAWIEQIIRFDTEMEYIGFEYDLKQSGKKYRILEEEKLPTGKYKVRLMKQYNNNNLPEM